jgi:atypical dual specificity phosphatase
MLSGFEWIIPNQLAGAAQPGLLAELDDDLAFLRRVGVARIVTLTTRPLPASVADAGFELIHFPIADMGIPTPRACERLCARLIPDLDRLPTLLHCRGGLGRTGTIAACCLVSLGQDPQQALAGVRRVNHNYVQSPAQRQFIGHYASWVTSAH